MLKVNCMVDISAKKFYDYLLSSLKKEFNICSIDKEVISEKWFEKQYVSQGRNAKVAVKILGLIQDSYYFVQVRTKDSVTTISYVFRPVSDTCCEVIYEENRDFMSKFQTFVYNFFDNAPSKKKKAINQIRQIAYAICDGKIGELK